VEQEAERRRQLEVGDCRRKKSLAMWWTTRWISPRLGHVALDGTKVLANASKHKAMSYGRMGEAERKRAEEVTALLAQAAAVDAAEDAQYGQGRRGDELPAELARRESRLAKIREAAKAAQEANDKQQRVPMLQAAVTNCGAAPTAASADSGYCSEPAVTAPAVAAIDLDVAPDRQKHEDAAVPAPLPDDGTVIGAMRAKVRGATGHAVYALRQTIVEPVFGQIKDARGFRRFSFRGLPKVQAEWLLICLTHNLLKLCRAGWRPLGASKGGANPRGIGLTGLSAVISSRLRSSGGRTGRLGGAGGTSAGTVGGGAVGASWVGVTGS